MTVTYPVDLNAFLKGVTPPAHALKSVGALSLEPHALHLVQVLHGRNALAGELLTHLLGFLDHVGLEHVLGALAVDIAVSSVE